MMWDMVMRKMIVVVLFKSATDKAMAGKSMFFGPNSRFPKFGSGVSAELSRPLFVKPLNFEQLRLLRQSFLYTSSQLTKGSQVEMSHIVNPDFFSGQ